MAKEGYLNSNKSNISGDINKVDPAT